MGAVRIQYFSQQPASFQTHVVVNTEFIPLVWVSVCVTVEMTTIVAVVTDPDSEPVTVTVAPLDSIVH